MDVGKLYNSVNLLNSRFDDAIRMYVQVSSKGLEGYAKKNAPWRDRTAHARQRLTGDYFPIQSGYRISLSHGVNYGKYLEGTNNPEWSKGQENQLTGLEAEFKYEKKFAIISPAIREYGEKTIMSGLRKLIDKLNK